MPTESRFWLIIKGPEHETAYEAAALRGIRLDSTGPIRDGQICGEGFADYRTVAAWFDETHDAPFPPGALLWFRQLG